FPTEYARTHWARRASPSVGSVWVSPRSAVQPTSTSGDEMTLVRIAASLRWSSDATRCSMRRMRPVSGTSTRRAHTAWRRPRQADVIRRALRVNVDGANPLQVVQATWNLLEPSAAAALADAKASGWGVIIKEALANGRLTDRGNAPEIAPLAREARSI